ncbi:MAG: hypothetical protein ACX94A_12295 [Algiphilus sp.]
MKAVFAALMMLLLVFGPVGQALATCCSAKQAEPTAVPAASEMEAMAAKMPCHGEAPAMAPSAVESGDAPHQHDCSTAINCCGAAVSALADAEFQALLPPRGLAPPVMEIASPRYHPDAFYRPPRRI